MAIIDTHAHYDDLRFDEDRDEIINSLPSLNVERVINSAATAKSCKETLELCAKYPFFYGLLGIHPTEIDDLEFYFLESIKDELKNNEKIVGIGEIGLDYYWVKEENEQERQKLWFRKQIELAKELKLPICIHSRDAAEATMKILEEYYPKNPDSLSGVVHCFGYSAEIAEECVKRGFLIGVGGVLTFKNARKLKEVVEKLPLSKIVLETDTPYMAPTPFRGERNNSSLLKYVVDEIANIKGITAFEVEKLTSENARKVYPKLV
ncbi:MAG: TatD family hydrolase [Lachnospiraceae bacterium]|nr:TatD family hydrolase [Lachnospiraceae bacterium]